MTAPDLTYTLVRPLTDKYLAIQKQGNLAVTFCFLINNVHFLRDDNVATKSVSQSRAALCEILATRICRELGNNTLSLATALTTSWSLYSGADPEMVNRARDERDDDLEEHVGNAIEIAILGKAKRFIKSAAVQKIINSIWTYANYYSQPEEYYSFVSIVEENVFIKPRVVILFSLMCVLVAPLAALSIDLLSDV